MIALPPSLAGALQVRATEPSVSAPLLNPVGVPGTPVVILIDKRACAVAPLASVTTTVKVFETAASVGVPLITPTLESVKPAGRVESLTPRAHVYGVAPPVATKVCV